MNLSEFVERRNGVPLGARGALGRMLQRSFGADSFHRFWQFWNPIWGYYLGTKVFRPAKTVVPTWLATVYTFAVSGALHDLAVSLVKWSPVIFFTPWFTIMGGVVVLSVVSGYSLSKMPFIVRASANLLIIVACYLLTNVLFH